MRYLLGIAILVAGIGYAQEFPISIAPGDQINPDVAWDGTNFWVVWADKRSGDFEIYGSRITPSGEILDTADVCLAAGTKFIMPSVDFGDSIGCVAFQYDTGFVYTTWDFYYSLFGVARFYSNGELIDSTTILVDWSPSYPDGGMIDYINIPICVFGKNNFFSFVEFGYCNWFECWECTEIQSLKEDRLVLIAGLPGFNSWAVTGIWNGKKFFTVWSQFPLGTCKVLGAFVQDSLGGQWLDPIQFKIRDENDFPPGIVNWDFGGYSARSKELAYSGSRYLLISETGWNNSKIWYDVLSDSGLPIDSLPTIIDNGDSVNQTYPICTYKDNKFYAVWQESSSVGVQLYGITVDTLGEILYSSYLMSGSNKKQPSITTGGDKLFLVWADDRNGNFDIYGMLMDSLAIEENEPSLSPISLKSEPNPFTQKTSIEFRVKSSELRELQLKIYDLSGRVIKQFNPLQCNQVIWDGTDNKGNLVPQGLYFCTLTRGATSSGATCKTIKLTLIK